MLKRAMLYYICGFPEQLHHPKEDQYLLFGANRDPFESMEAEDKHDDLYVKSSLAWPMLHSIAHTNETEDYKLCGSKRGVASGLPYTDSIN